MAIQYARMTYVSRSTGGNACRKAAYNERSVIKDEQSGQLYYFKHKKDNVHHEVLLPEGADERFKSSSVLWNEAEKAERRKDSQVAKEIIAALPDDPILKLEDRIELARRMADHFFVSKGLAVQIDLHAPHEGEKNWHAHLLGTTRRFSEDGKSFHKQKARDTDPGIARKVVVKGDPVGEIWRDIQNRYFEEQGWDLRVDAIGIIPQVHLGPERLRAILGEVAERNELLKEANQALCKNPEEVLKEMTSQKAVFDHKDVERFVYKHVEEGKRREVLDKVLSHKEVVPLYDSVTGIPLNYYTTQTVRKEEEKLLRFAKDVSILNGKKIKEEVAQDVLSSYSLSQEQKAAFDWSVHWDKGLVVLKGRAGVGKSYVVRPIREAHEASSYRVIGIAPTNKVVQDLKEDGFKEAMTCHRFLFRIKNEREKIDHNTVLVVDEAAMLGTSALVELFKVARDHYAKVILVGDDKQLSSIDRGGMFSTLDLKVGSVQLSEVRRQELGWQRTISEELSQGRVKEALWRLDMGGRIIFQDTKEETIHALINAWGRDTLADPSSRRFVLALRNVDVDALNHGIREVRKERGELGENEFALQTNRGLHLFAQGDRIQLTETDKERGLYNGSFGTIQVLEKETCTLKLDQGKEVTFDPSTYTGLRHGYAGTVYKAQGATIPYTYVLHDRATFRNLSYVALTRQVRDLTIFVNRYETPNLASMVYQSSRWNLKHASIEYATKEDLDRPQNPTWKHKLQDFATRVWDFFHSNPSFYQFDKKETDPQKPVQAPVSTFDPHDRKADDICDLLIRRWTYQQEGREGAAAQDYLAQRAEVATQWIQEKANEGVKEISWREIDYYKNKVSETIETKRTKEEVVAEHKALSLKSLSSDETEKWVAQEKLKELARDVISSKRLMSELDENNKDLKEELQTIHEKAQQKDRGRGR